MDFIVDPDLSGLFSVPAEAVKEVEQNEVQQNAAAQSDDAEPESVELEQNEETLDSTPIDSDALGEAVRKAREEERRESESLLLRARAAEIERNAPRLLRYENLSDEDRAAVEAEAEMAGVDPQQVLYWHYKEQERAYRSERSSLEASVNASRDNARKAAFEFFNNHEAVRGLPAEEAQKLSAQIGELDSIKAVDPLFKHDPAAWSAAVIAIARHHLGVEVARRKAKSDSAAKHAAMKTSLGTGKSAATKIQDADPLDVVLQNAMQGGSWERRMGLK